MWYTTVYCKPCTSRRFSALIFVNFSFAEITQNIVNIQKSPKCYVCDKMDNIITQNVYYYVFHRIS